MIEVQEFRSEVRDWLAENLVGEYAALKGLGEIVRKPFFWDKTQHGHDDLVEETLAKFSPAPVQSAQVIPISSRS